MLYTTNLEPINLSTLPIIYTIRIFKWNRQFLLPRSPPFVLCALCKLAYSTHSGWSAFPITFYWHRQCLDRGTPSRVLHWFKISTWLVSELQVALRFAYQVLVHSISSNSVDNFLQVLELLPLGPEFSPTTRTPLSYGERFATWSSDFWFRTVLDVLERQRIPQLWQYARGELVHLHRSTSFVAVLKFRFKLGA